MLHCDYAIVFYTGQISCLRLVVLMDITLSEPGGRTLTLRTATMLLHTSTPPTNSAWMPSLSRTCLKSDRRGSLINTD